MSAVDDRAPHRNITPMETRDRDRITNSATSRFIFEAIAVLLPSVITLFYAIRVATHDFQVRQPGTSYTPVGIFGILVTLTFIILFLAIAFCGCSVTPVGTFGVTLYIVAVAVGTSYTYTRMSGIGYRALGYIGGVFWIILTLIGLTRYRDQLDQELTWFPELDATRNDGSKAKIVTVFSGHLISLTIALCVIVSAIILCVVSAVNAGATLHPVDYMAFNYGIKEGYGGVTVGVKFDYNNMAHFYEDIVHFKNDCREEGDKWLKENGYDSAIELVCEYIVQPDESGESTTRLDGTTEVSAVYGFDIYPDEYLKNGDTIVLSWNFFGKEDEFTVLMDHLNVTFDYNDVSIPVTGIPE